MEEVHCTICLGTVCASYAAAHTEACIATRADEILSKEGVGWPQEAIDALHPRSSGKKARAGSTTDHGITITEWDATEVLPGIFLGGRAAGISSEFIRKHGIQVLVDCAEPSDGRPLGPQEAAEAGLEKHVHLELEDQWPIPWPPLPGDIIPGVASVASSGAGVTLVKSSMGDEYRSRILYGARVIAEAGEKGLPVLVHCVAGRSRSATVLLTYLMLHRGMSLREALAIVRVARPEVAPVLGFWRFLVALDAEGGAGCPSVPLAALKLHREAIVAAAAARTAPPLISYNNLVHKK